MTQILYIKYYKNLLNEYLTARILHTHTQPSAFILGNIFHIPKLITSFAFIPEHYTTYQSILAYFA
jgi:hypothetical protein